MTDRLSSQASDDVFDITILGGGPTGLFAAFYAGMRNMRCKLIDSMPVLGGRLSAIYPEKHIYDVAGFPKILAQDLVRSLVLQIKPYPVSVCLNESSLSLSRAETGLWLVETDKGVHQTRTVLVAAGVGAYRPKKHPAESARQFEGNGVFYTVLNKLDYLDKRVVIVGGGDSALDWANELVSIAREVVLIHRSDRLRAHESSFAKFQKTGSRALLGFEILDFQGNGGRLERVVVQDLNNPEGETQVLLADAVIVMFGFQASLGKIKEWGLELDGNRIVVNEKMETSLPGVFAAGDIVKYGAKLDLIVTGFAEAAIAVAFAKVFLNPKEKPQPIHSTTLMEKKHGG